VFIEKVLLARADVPASAAIVGIFHEIRAAQAKGQLRSVALTFTIDAHLLWRARMAARSAVLWIVRDVRLAAVPAAIVVAVTVAAGDISDAIEPAFRARTDGTEVRRKDAWLARPHAGAGVVIRDPALRPAGAAIVAIAIELGTGISALRIPRGAAARTTPANIVALAGVPARAAVQRVVAEVDFAAIRDVTIAISRL
jgi:hypothetical protein